MNMHYYASNFNTNIGVEYANTQTHNRVNIDAVNSSYFILIHMTLCKINPYYIIELWSIDWICVMQYH